MEDSYAVDGSYSLTGLASILLFEVLWLNKWDIYEYVQQVPDSGYVTG